MRARRLILIILATIGFTSFFLSFPYFDWLTDNSPHSPPPVTQQVYELNDHGYLFYVTHNEYWLFQGLSKGGLSLSALAALLNYRWKVIHNLTPQGWQPPK